MSLRNRARATLLSFRRDAPASARQAVPATLPPASPQGAALGPFASLAKRAAAGDLGTALYADDASTGREAYIARMKANGRDVELAGEGLNTNDDGIQFWGPIENESSIAKAAGEVLTIDQWECISCGTCEENTKVVFHLPDQEDDKAEVLIQDGPMDLIQDAIDACPVTCISWMSPDGVEEQHSHGGFDPQNA